MTLQGDLRTMELQDLLQWLANAEVSGTLLFRHRAGDLIWRMSKGRLVGIEGGDIDRWAAARVGAEAWHKARTWAEREHSSPEAILVRVGLLDAAEVPAWRMAAAKRALHAILLREDGWFHFTPGAISGEGLPAEQLLMEVAVEFDEWQKLRRRFGRGFVWIEAAPGQTLEDLPEDWAPWLQAGVHLVELGWLLAADVWDLARELDSLADAGRVLVLPVEPPVVTDPLKLYQEAMIAQRGFHFEEAAAGYEDAISAAWDDAAVRDAAARWLERYEEMVTAHLLPADSMLKRNPDAQPQPGDPWAAWLLRTLETPMKLAELRRTSPFHPFFVTRAARRQLAAGALRLAAKPEGGSAA